nr:PREDICTED: zinc finger protein OZF isoform X23 [Tribolium castaneum]|eukprot:XP_015834138.1 PREDICTED: zinc finger protein OZF isoform X23 [Tribolium castaneum]
MGSIENISELCRLCLVKDQVNVPIFEENATKEQTFVKINSCLPVKVSRDDSLPKKICDGCSCKLDMLYTFRNTSVDSEKQLLKWLNQAGLSCSQSAVKDPLASTKPEVTIKQETFEPTDSRDDLGLDTHSYIMQQQKLPYSQEFEFGEPSESNVGLMTDEPAPKKAKRAAALNKASVETDEDDLDAAMQITKAEDEDSDEIDQPEYVEAPSTSADDQPGPSGVNKTTVEAPRNRKKDSYPCIQCAKSFPSNRKLKRHLITHSQARPFPCDLCPKRFKRKYELVIHKRVHSGVLAFPCELCDKVLKSKGSYVTHKRRHLKNFIQTCQICDMGFVTNQEYYNHMGAKHGAGTHLCKYCGRSCYDKATLKSHEEKHAAEYKTNKFKCEFCDKTFLQEKYLRQHHVRIHIDGGQKFVCDLCGKRVSSRTSLRDHLLMHSGQKPIKCKLCGKGFVLKTTLKSHMRTHTGDRPYVCKECGKAFTQKAALNTHMKYHTGERPHVCDICQAGFVSRGLLNLHVKNKHVKAEKIDD